MRAGGDGYKLFKDNGQNAYDYGPGLEQVVADYIRANSPYQPVTDGRILKGGMFDMAIAEKPAMAEEKPAMAEGGYVIKAGDTLWSIAAEKYGDPYQWRKIRDANGIGNTRKLEIGQTITLP